MDTTCVIDYGSHTVKYACLSKSEKALPSDFRIEETGSRAYVDDSMDVTQLGTHLAEIISSECHEETDLTIAILMDALISQRKKELVLKCCLEYLDAKRVFLGYSATTALFSAGETTGLSVDVGYRGVRIVPIYNSVVQTPLCHDLKGIGARSADMVLSGFLPNPTEALLKVLKSTACFVGDKVPTISRELNLPDGTSLPLHFNTDAFREAGRSLLFHPPLVSAPDVLHYTYQKCLLHESSLRHLVIFGGASNVMGVNETLREAVSHALSPTQETLNKLSLKSSQHAAVIGGAILSQLSSFKGMCVSAAEYIEDGPHRCIHLKSVDGR